MPSFPRVIPDLRHRAVSVVLSDAEIAGTHALDDAHLVDLDANGDPVAIEILTLDDWKLVEMGEAFDFSTQVPAIRAALKAIFCAPTGTAVTYGKAMEIRGTGTPPQGRSVQEETNESSEHAVVPPIMAPVTPEVPR